MAGLPLSSVLDGPEALFIPLDGLPERFQQSLRIDRARDDPGVKLGFPMVGVQLTKVEHELNAL